MYQTGDVVNYGGYSYSAKTIHSSTDTPNADTTNWAVLTVGFSAQGAWVSGTTYKPGDVVRYGGNSYVMTVTAVAGTAPTVSRSKVSRGPARSKRHTRIQSYWQA